MCRVLGLCKLHALLSVNHMCESTHTRSWPRAGKGGVGKSSTANLLLGERVANVAALQSDVARPQVIARSADGFTLTLIDTPGLLEADAVSDAVRLLQAALLCMSAGLGHRRPQQEPALPHYQACAQGLVSAAVPPQLFSSLVITVRTCTALLRFMTSNFLLRWPAQEERARAGAKCSMERGMKAKQTISDCTHNLCYFT